MILVLNLLGRGKKEILKEITNRVLRIMLGSSRNEIICTKETHIKENNLICTVAGSVISIISQKI